MSWNRVGRGRCQAVDLHRYRCRDIGMSRYRDAETLGGRDETETKDVVARGRRDIGMTPKEVTTGSKHLMSWIKVKPKPITLRTEDAEQELVDGWQDEVKPENQSYGTLANTGAISQVRHSLAELILVGGERRGRET
ncbi:hypothetical protein ACFE04_030509 [Oxalis oulophora]